MITLKHPLNLDSISRILVVQYRQIGDVLLSTPFVRIISNNFPNSRIDFLTEAGPAQILEGNPYIHDILLFPYRNEHLKALRFYKSLGNNKYDLVFDIQGTTGTALASLFSRAPNRIGYAVRGRRWAYTLQVQPPGEGEYTAVNRLCLLKAIGIKDTEWDLDLTLSDLEKEFAEQFYSKMNLGNKFVVAVSPTSRRQTRCWTSGGFIATIKLLIEKYGAKILMLWGPGENQYVAKIASAAGPEAVMIPSAGIKQLAAIIARSKVLVTNNNGPKHIATALGIPTVAVYGSSSDRAWNPPDRVNHRVVKANIPCIGCHLSYCEHLSCMHLVNEFDVEKALLQIPSIQHYLTSAVSGSKNN